MIELDDNKTYKYLGINVVNGITHTTDKIKKGKKLYMQNKTHIKNRTLYKRYL